MNKFVLVLGVLLFAFTGHAAIEDGLTSDQITKAEIAGKTLVKVTATKLDGIMEYIVTGDVSAHSVIDYSKLKVLIVDAKLDQNAQDFLLVPRTPEIFRERMAIRFSLVRDLFSALSGEVKHCQK